MQTTDTNLQNGAPTANGDADATAKPSARDGHENPENAGRRSDENRLHVLRHGILSRNLLEAMVQRGENPREWRNFIRELHAELQVEGALAELYFDRMCASMMRDALISNAERAIFIAKDEGPEFDSRLKQASMVVRFTNTKNVGDPQALDLLRYLPVIQRYRSQCRRDFERDLGAVLALSDGGSKELARFLSKTAAAKKNTESDE